MNADRLQAWRQWRQASGIRPSTIVVQSNIVGRFAQDHDLDTATSADVAGWLAGHHDWGPESRKSGRNALRSYYKWATAAGVREADPTANLAPVRVPPPCPKPVPEPTLVATLSAAADQERLMVLLAAFAGLRRSEIAGLHCDDLSGDLLRVRGKGGRTRVIPVAGELLDLLQTRPPGYVFPGRFPGTHVCPDHVGRTLSRMLPPGYTGHKLRHRYASRIYARTNNLFVLQDLLGHSSPETTRRYVAVNPDDLRRVAAAAM